MTGADVSLHVVDLVRLRVDLVPPVEAVVVEVLCHLLFVLVQGGATPCGGQTDRQSSSERIAGGFIVVQIGNKIGSGSKRATTTFISGEPFQIFDSRPASESGRCY